MLRELPQELYVRGSINMERCLNIRTIDQNIHLNGLNLNISFCTSLTSLPDWVFELRSNQSVTAQNTGIPARLLAEYNNRQNAPEYTGPRINFSINDYRSTSDVRATQLPNLVQTITQTDTNHTFWQFTANQTEQGSPFNAFALFLTRLLNELPTGDKRQTDLVELRQKLTPLFRKMEAEYESNRQDISQCDFINNVLSST